jgi:hypothetical protein
VIIGAPYQQGFGLGAARNTVAGLTVMRRQLATMHKMGLANAVFFRFCPATNRILAVVPAAERLEGGGFGNFPKSPDCGAKCREHVSRRPC